ncbi:TIGR00725 family protein [Methanococcoides orientis]|uniref:TIGR00725 family protein n=1 Tax=Methanococcoides orientis TaxID=2822137 RepID=UPI00201BCF12|nr:TIGR00725 family protein [Methanococcoides orientis]
MIQIGVIGAGSCDKRVAKLAETVGAEIAKNDAILICGGLGGVMEAAAMGCKAEGGQTIGILPGNRKEDANAYIDLVIVTAMGHARNAIIAQSCDTLIAVDGEYGTLSEIALSLKMGKPVVTLESKWDVEGAWVAASPEDAVKIALGLFLTR